MGGQLKALIETRNTRPERVFLVGAEFKSRPGADLRESLAELGELAELGDGFSLVEDEFTIPETKDSGPTKFEVVTTSSGWYGLRLHERDYLITKNRRDFYHWLNSEYATNSEFLDFSLTFNSTKPHRPDRSTLW